MRRSFAPEVHSPVLVIAAVDVDRARVECCVREEQDANLDRLRTSVHEIPIEEVWVRSIGCSILKVE